MANSLNLSRNLPLDDQGPFADLDRFRIDMLNEDPPEPAECLFADERVIGNRVLDRLRFFRWILDELYGGSVSGWENSLERRDERLDAMRVMASAAGDVPCHAVPAA
jgi:hypothetical protein